MFSFIILHYKNIDETIECLTYLQKLDLKDAHIIIVDNKGHNIYSRYYSDEFEGKEYQRSSKRKFVLRQKI